MAEGSTLRYTEAPDRRARILRAVRRSGVITPAQLADELAVSDRTVRRDLRKLAEDGQIRLTHGSAYLADGVRGAVDFPDRRATRTAQKQAIARRAAADIGPGDTIALDSGTTTWALARALPELPDLTVATHSLPAMSALQARADLSLIVLGGFYHGNTMSVAGPDTRQAIGRLQVDTLFLSATSFGTGGIYCATPFDAETKQALIDVSRRVVLLADSSKAQTTAPFHVCGMDRVDLLITDDGLSQDDRAVLGEVRVDLVGVD
jgi:DeoR family fructose operon transcriptional repressor